jgi:hypothetical protein
VEDFVEVGEMVMEDQGGEDAKASKANGNDPG